MIKINKHLIISVAISSIVLLFILQPAQAINLEVKFFDIQGLRLNMSLDSVINNFNINNIKAIKDKFGIISEYEVKKNVGTKSLFLRFTGNKRLYRIQYINVYRSYINRSGDILAQLAIKYGNPTWKYHTNKGEQPLDIYACWGNQCSRESYAPIVPTLTANIYYRSGKVKLILANHTIYKEDWENYKTKRQGFQQKKDEQKTRKPENLEF